MIAVQALNICFEVIGFDHSIMFIILLLQM